MQERKGMSAGAKWLTGCGIGCGVVVLVVGALGVGGFFFIKDTVEGFDEIQQVSDEMSSRFGRISEHRPGPDGSIRPERLQAFLEVRESLLTVREEMNTRLAELARAEKDGVILSPFRVFGLIRSGIGLIPRMIEYAKERNVALLAHDMGLGEYLYIYPISYYSWLGKKPEDGPPFRLISQEDGEEEDEDLTTEEILEARRREIRHLVNGYVLPMLASQMEDLERSGSGLTRHADWHRRLRREIDAMEEDSLRLPWEDGLPPELLESLEPFRQELEAGYVPLVNSMEIAITTQ